MDKEHTARMVLDWLAARREEIIDFTCQLVATPSSNPPGDERAVADLILARMQALGLKGVEVVAKAPQRPNLIYRQPGKTGSPSLILSGHIDTYAGIPSIPAFGPGLLPLANGPNEYVSTESILQASEIYALAALDYLDPEAAVDTL